MDVFPIERTSSLRRPVVGLALSLILGIEVGLRAPVPVFAETAAGILLCLLAVTVRRAGLAVFLATALAGGALAELAVRDPSPRNVAGMVSGAREYTTLIATIDDDPARAGTAEQGVTAWSVPLRLEGIRRLGDWQRVRGHVSAFWKLPENESPLAYGDRWLVSGLLQVDTNDAARMSVESTSARRLGTGEGHALLALCLRGRTACSRILSQGIESFPREAGLLRALILGYREDLPDDLYRAFTQTGTLHIVAISGSHIGAFLILLVAVVKALGLSRQHWILLIAPVLILYTMGTGMSSSAVRACIMAIVFWLAPFFRRRQDGPSALAFAAILILIAAPSQIADAGFILSFGIVGGLMLLYPRLIEPVNRYVRIDPWRVQEETWPVRCMRGSATAVLALLAASLAAWLVSSPLTAVYFNNVSFVSLIANLFVVPLSALILVTGCLSLCLGACSLLLAEIFNHANRVFTSLLLWIVDAFNALPHGHVFVMSPTWAWIVVWYAVVVAVILGKGRMRRMGLITGAAAVFFAAALYVTDDSMTIDVAGTSDTVAALVNVPGGGDVLINPGPEWSSRRVIRWLRSRGVDRLHALVIASPRADTAGAAAQVLQQIPVDELWTVPYEGRSPVAREIVRAAEEMGITVRRLAYGDGGSLAGPSEWEILHPARGEDSSNAADAGMALRFGCAGASVVYMDTCGEAQEQHMRDRRFDTAADLLIVGTLNEGDVDSSKVIDARAVVMNIAQGETRSFEFPSGRRRD